jgi:hypothetical protein
MDDPRRTVHRISRGVPLIGAFGAIFSVYVASYSAGLTDLVLFPKVTEFRTAGPGL